MPPSCPGCRGPGPLRRLVACPHPSHSPACPGATRPPRRGALLVHGLGSNGRADVALRRRTGRRPAGAPTRWTSAVTASRRARWITRWRRTPPISPATSPAQRPAAGTSSSATRSAARPPPSPPRPSPDWTQTAGARSTPPSRSPDADREIVRASQERVVRGPLDRGGARRASALARAGRRAEVAVGAAGEPLGGASRRACRTARGTCGMPRPPCRAHSRDRVGPVGVQHLHRQPAQSEVEENPLITMSVVAGAGHSPHRDKPEATIDGAAAGARRRERGSTPREQCAWRFDPS